MLEITRINDIERLMMWRGEVIRNVFGIEPTPKLLDENRRYYLSHVSDETHIAFVASNGSEECGCGAICLSDELPSPDNPSGRCAYLMNIYVREAFRNHGIAHKIVSRLIEEAKARNCGKIYLETTADGKPVYSSLGFRDMADMMKYYDAEN
ncbi:MAG: GNAT family N-acetyltransferase [Muribaculaceae bacterium]|nr:GNAT family N-acetyltransferase [Muribaculaceae bacterium]